MGLRGFDFDLWYFFCISFVWRVGWQSVDICEKWLIMRSSCPCTKGVVQGFFYSILEDAVAKPGSRAWLKKYSEIPDSLPVESDKDAEDEKKPKKKVDSVSRRIDRRTKRHLAKSNLRRMEQSGMMHDLSD
jgi:hypothetical protein